jgi:predicted dehydrogenase
VHRRAAALDNRYELVAAALSSDPARSLQAGRELGLAPERAYASGPALLAGERAIAGGADVVAIMTPNDSHFELASAALAAGFDVICDKPMTNTLDEAQRLHAAVTASGKVFCLTHNYTGYPMVRQARAMVEAGELGEIRLVQVEYVQGGNARPFQPGQGRSWCQDPRKGGPSLVMGDIGCHAHNLLRFITGLEVTEVAAEVGSIVPGRVVHDYAGALLRLDMGARGSFWVTQAAAGVENSLRIRVSGALGTLEWQQEVPQALSFKSLDGPAQVRTPNGPGTLPLAARSSRIVRGHPEGFLEAFANLYSDAAEVIAAGRAGTTPDPLAMHFPTSHDGLLGARFISAVIRSSEANGAWVPIGN